MKSVFGLLVILLFTSLSVSGQDNKEKQHIKVIISDKGGEKVVIDTSFAKIASVDSIKLKDGQMVYIARDDGFVTAHATSGEPGKVFIVKSDGTHSSSGETGVMTWVASDGNSEGKSIVYISKGESQLKDGEVKYNIEVKTDDSGNKSEKTSYVVAKDGMVVTIEGGDEARVKELASVIEAKLGVSKDTKKGTQEVKEETKKTTKK